MARPARPSVVRFQNPALHSIDVSSHRRMKVVVLSANHPEFVVETQINLPLNWLGRSSMNQLDIALKTIQIKRARSRLYWQVTKNQVLPIFNFVTLTAAIYSTSASNSVIYIVKKGKQKNQNQNENFFKVDPNDRDLILKIASKKEDFNFTGYTRFEETTYLALVRTAFGGHLPAQLMPKEEEKPPVGKSTAKSDKSKSKK